MLPAVAVALYNQANRVLNIFTHSKDAPDGWESVYGQWVRSTRRGEVISISGWRIPDRAEITLCVSTRDNRLLTLYVCRLAQSSAKSEVVDCLFDTPHLCSWMAVEEIAPFLEHSIADSAV